jgi:DNA polymerase III alpha subunit (gram-positive type)
MTSEFDGLVNPHYHCPHCQDILENVMSERVTSAGDVALYYCDNCEYVYRMVRESDGHKYPLRRLQYVGGLAYTGTGET